MFLRLLLLPTSCYGWQRQAARPLGLSSNTRSSRRPVPLVAWLVEGSAANSVPCCGRQHVTVTHRD